MKNCRSLKRLLTIVATTFCGVSVMHAELTLEQAFAKAEENYPLIVHYDLIGKTRDIGLDEINRGWLPKMSLYGQGTVQNEVPGFPEILSGMMTQMGQKIVGLSKIQYKVGVDLNQTIWDGGASKSQRELTRAVAEVEKASLDVRMYDIRERVLNIYFGILLMESQIDQAEQTLGLLEANVDKLRSMVKNGVAMASDMEMVEAQFLTAGQNLAEARAAVKAYRKMLGWFVGSESADEKLTLPVMAGGPDGYSNRPELRLFDLRLDLNMKRIAALDVDLMPKIGFFAQAYYGYPGFNYFESMMKRSMSFNAIAGIKVSWNIDSFYTRSLSRRKIELDNIGIEADRNTFGFNNDMTIESELEYLVGLDEVMKDDLRIVELRENVRRAAESQLENGVIDVTALITKITEENRAKLSLSYHKIQYLHKYYQVRHNYGK